MIFAIVLVVSIIKHNKYCHRLAVLKTLSLLPEQDMTPEDKLASIDLITIKKKKTRRQKEMETQLLQGALAGKKSRNQIFVDIPLYYDKR